MISKTEDADAAPWPTWRLSETAALFLSLSPRQPNPLAVHLQWTPLRSCPSLYLASVRKVRATHQQRRTSRKTD